MDNQRMDEPGVSFEERGDTLLVHMRGELDHHMARPWRQQIDAHIFRMHPVLLVLDFSGVPFMDSSGVGLILGRVEVMEQMGGAVRLCGLVGTMRRVVQLSGVEHMRRVTVE